MFGFYMYIDVFYMYYMYIDSLLYIDVLREGAIVQSETLKKII